MTRIALAVLALVLLACAPPSDGDEAVPAAAPAAPRGPSKPARQPAAPKKSLQPKESLEAGSYYQYVDESGRVSFAASLDQVPERQRSTAGHISVTPPAAPRRAAPQRRSAAVEDSTTDARVVLYTTRSCPWCKKAVKYLDSLGQDYVNKDVEEDAEARDEYLRLTNGRAGVPVVLVGRKWMQGWNQQQFDEMLAASR